MREDLGLATEELLEEDNDMGGPMRRFLEDGSFMTEIQDDSPGQHSQRTSRDIFKNIRTLFILFFTIFYKTNIRL